MDHQTARQSFHCPIIPQYYIEHCRILDTLYQKHIVVIPNSWFLYHALPKSLFVLEYQWLSPSGTFHILIGKFSYFIIRFSYTGGPPLVRSPLLWIPLKYGFCNKSFRKDETLTSWTQVEHFFNIFIIKIRFSLSNVLIRGESNPLQCFD